MPSTTSLLRRGAVAAAVLLLPALLSGCAAGGGTGVAASASSGATAASRVFSCPSADQVAGLTALPFARERSAAGRCGYATSGGADPARILVRRGFDATGSRVRDLAVLRRQVAADSGTTVRTAPHSSSGAFTAESSSGACSAWVYGVDGVVTRITASAAGATGDACRLATATSVLLGTADGPATPVVSVLATAAGRSVLPRLDGVRIVAVPGAGPGLVPVAGGSPSLVTAAARVDPQTAVVVLVGDAADAGQDRLAVLRAATKALSAARAVAPQAALLVVGPAADAAADADADAVRSLRADLRVAARIAGAGYVAPTADPAASSDRVAARVAAAVRSDAEGR